MLNRIKYTEEKKCIDHIILLGISTAVTQKLLEQSLVRVGGLFFGAVVTEEGEDFDIFFSP